MAVGGPGRIRRGVKRPRQPFAGAPFVVALGALEFRHQYGDAFGRCGEMGRERGARLGEFLRVERGARNRQRAFDMAGHALGQRFDPLQPVARGLP